MWSLHGIVRASGGAKVVHNRAFTLIELLVVVSIIGLLIALVAPAQRKARMQARMVRVHADLRQISMSLDVYALDNRGKLPPTRSACGTDVNYQLPVELANDGYLPPSPSRIPQANFMDLFRPGQTYRYRAPGPIWFNGSFFDFPDSTWRPRAKIWVPDDFPRCLSVEGQYYANRSYEPPSPIRYAIWSIGPNPESPKFPRYDGFPGIDEAKLPLLKSSWLKNCADTGLITHFSDRKGLVYMSP